MQCEQPPARLISSFPTGDGCFGTADERRQCYMERVSQWAIGVQWLYKTEVDKRAAEDRCLASLRKSGVIL